jgi:hypothetical protein
MNNISVIIYSKFSAPCKKLLYIIKSYDLNFNLLCIDNSKVRTKVLNSKTIKINYVPCILNVNKSTGVVEQYEGIKSFELVNQIIVTMQPQHTEPQHTEPQHTEPQHTPLDQISYTEDQQTDKFIDTKAVKKKLTIKEVTEAMARERLDMSSSEQKKDIPERIIPKKAGSFVDISDAIANARK